MGQTVSAGGKKTWELRSRPTARRGRIAIAASGTHGLVGEVSLVGCICVGMRGPGGRLTPPDTADGRLNFLGSAANMPKHCVTDLSMIKYKRVWAWVMEAPLAYDEPKSFVHRRGVVTWQHLSTPVDPAVGKAYAELGGA